MNLKSLMVVVGYSALLALIAPAEETQEAPAVQAVAPTNTATAPSQAQQYALAFESLAQADLLREQDMPEEALELYLEAKRFLQRLAEAHPEWEPRLLTYRIQYCDDQITNLQAQLADAASFIAPGAAATMPATEPVTSLPPVQLPLVPTEILQLEPVELKKIEHRLHTASRKERAQDYQGALEQYFSILSVQSRQAVAIKGAARCCLKVGLYDDAHDFLELGMKNPEPDMETRLLMALAYCQRQEFHKAYPLLIIVLNSQPANPLARLALGVVQAGLAQWDEARLETQKALQLDPKLGEAYYNLARICFKQKPSNPSLAATHYASALRHGATPDPEFARRISYSE